VSGFPARFVCGRKRHETRENIMSDGSPSSSSPASWQAMRDLSGRGGMSFLQVATAGRSESATGTAFSPNSLSSLLDHLKTSTQEFPVETTRSLSSSTSSSSATSSFYSDASGGSGSSVVAGLKDNKVPERSNRPEGFEVQRVNGARSLPTTSEPCVVIQPPSELYADMPRNKYSEFAKLNMMVQLWCEEDIDFVLEVWEGSSLLQEWTPNKISDDEFLTSRLSVVGVPFCHCSAKMSGRLMLLSLTSNGNKLFKSRDVNKAPRTIFFRFRSTKTQTSLQTLPVLFKSKLKSSWIKRLSPAQLQFMHSLISKHRAKLRRAEDFISIPGAPFSLGAMDFSTELVSVRERVDSRTGEVERPSVESAPTSQLPSFEQDVPGLLFSLRKNLLPFEKNPEKFPNDAKEFLKKIMTSFDGSMQAANGTIKRRKLSSPLPPQP